MMAFEPSFLLLAGPNGSGKSTVSRTIRKLWPQIYYISPDDVVKDVSAEVTDPWERHLRAIQLVDEVLMEAFQQGESVMLETVMSSDHKWTYLQDAHRHGLKTIGIFVSTRDVEVNIARVAKRVREGGHDVPVEKIRDRYVQSMNRLGKLIALCDQCYVYDNSTENGNPELLFCKSDNKHFITNQTEAGQWIYSLFEQWITEGICSERDSFSCNIHFIEQKLLT